MFRNPEIIALGIFCFLNVPALCMGQNPYTSSYQYITVYENTVFGEVIKFWGADTLEGPVHSNDTLSMMGGGGAVGPVFWDTVSTSADFINIISGSPTFAVPPIYNAPRVCLPATAAALRDSATAQGFFFDDDNGTLASRLAFDDIQGWVLYQWPMEMQFVDSIVAVGPPPVNAAIFVDGYLELSGIVRGTVTVGASGNPNGLGRNCIRLLADVRYWFADSVTGEFNDTTGGYTDMLSVISEGDIVVANTLANGRDNGRNVIPTGMWRHSIVITGSIVALGESFTFEDQNDNFIWEYSTGYLGPYQDERGDIILHGSMAQHRRGYVHRNNHGAPGGGPSGGTGYGKHYLFDARCRQQYPPFGILARHIPIFDPPSLNFGSVEIMTVDLSYVWLRNEGGTYIEIDSAFTDGEAFHIFPFGPITIQPNDSLLLTVAFSPYEEGWQYDTIRIQLYYGDDLKVPLSGQGVVLGILEEPIAKDSDAIHASPNPFNAATVLSYRLPVASNISLEVFDISGRKLVELASGFHLPGQYRYVWDASGRAAGIYFARLEAGEYVGVEKLILLK